MDEINKKFMNLQKDIAKKRRKLDRSSGNACNDMNHTASDNDSCKAQHPVNDTAKSKVSHIGRSKKKSVVSKSSSSGKKQKPSSSSRKKRVYKYCEDDFPRGPEKRDATRAESRAVHKKICRVQRDVVARAVDKRISDRKQRRAFNALQGIRGLCADEMLASDIKLRFQFGSAFIDQMYELWQRYQHDPRLKVYHVTALSDQFQMNVRDGTADVKGVIDKFQAAIRSHTSFHAVGVAETQVIVGQANDRGKESFYLHIHAICWGYGEDDMKNFIKRSRGYQAQLTKVPILAQPLRRTEGDFTRLGRYLSKPPYEGKKVNIQKYEAGEKCLRSTLSGVEKYHRFRLLELLAKLPLEHSIFGVREGVAKKDSILRPVREFHRTRSVTKVPLSGMIDELFKDFFEKNNGRFGNFKPMTVIKKRSRK